MDNIWNYIQTISQLPNVKSEDWEYFLNFQKSHQSYTKSAGNNHHLCTFFLPYDQGKGMIYLGHHKKADDWIPPGGHIESNETPIAAAIREMKEELRVEIKPDSLKPWNLSVKYIGRPEEGCDYHYDIWFLVHTHVQNYDFLRLEYHAASWMTIKEAGQKIKKNPDFAEIIAKLS